MDRKGLFACVDERRYEGEYKEDKKEVGGEFRTSKFYIYNYKYFYLIFNFMLFQLL